jgi:hypothetical protein
MRFSLRLRDFLACSADKVFNRKARKDAKKKKREEPRRWPSCGAASIGHRDSRTDIQPVNERSFAAEPSKKIVPTTML